MPLALDLQGLCQRIGEQSIDRDIFVNELINKGTVRSIFQKTPDQIRQKFFIAANRRIDPTRLGEFRVVYYVVIECFAHSMQTLEFEFLDFSISGLFAHRCKRMGVVRCELRINYITGIQHLPGANEITQIGVKFSCKYRVADQPLNLSTLDFRIPVGAFDEADHQTAPG